MGQRLRNSLPICSEQEYCGAVYISHHLLTYLFQFARWQRYFTNVDDAGVAHSLVMFIFLGSVKEF